MTKNQKIGTAVGIGALLILAGGILLYNATRKEEDETANGEEAPKPKVDQQKANPMVKEVPPMDQSPIGMERRPAKAKVNQAKPKPMSPQRAKKQQPTEVIAEKNKANVIESQKPPAPENRDPNGFPLQLGSYGKNVERLQVWLLRNYGWFGKVNGIMDEKTVARMKQFLRVDALDMATFEKYGMAIQVHEQPFAK